MFAGSPCHDIRSRRRAVTLKIGEFVADKCGIAFRICVRIAFFVVTHL